MSESTELQRAIENLTNTVEKLRDDLVRKDVYSADQKTLDERIKGLERAVLDIKADFEKAEQKRDSDRRLLVTGLVLPIVVLVISLYLAAQTGGAS
ncbi:hypothetical protein [Nocardioides kribbensis]|uniref:DUF3618 domain-containing protein n=1 Tax=Nocardioides kribbensis TaxID=305517 RepID=A0ABV1NZ17_9ACTN